MFRKLKTVHYFIFSLILVIISLCLYVFVKYEVLQNPITSVNLIFTNEVGKEDIPIVYISSDNESEINFKTVYKFKDTGNLTYQCRLDGTKKLRRIRLYFPHPNRTVSIKEINLKTETKVVNIPLLKFKKREGINCSVQSNEIELEVLIKNGYIELPNVYVYSSDFNNILQLILPLVIVLILLGITIKTFNPIQIKSLPVPIVAIYLFVLSIFLPAPAYNVALILMALLNIKRLSWEDITSQKGNLIILGFFMVYAFNNFFISEEGFNELSILERFLPFLVLSVVLPSIANRKYLSLFPISAFVLGFGFLLTSIFDVFIHQNFVFLSFDFFAKYLHPVYFSYLIFFSICYIDLHYSGKYKYILEFILFVFLIFCGSKMVFLFSLIVVFMNLLKNKKTVLLIIPLALIVIIFSPLKHRFSEIINQDDLSVLNESHIKNPNDSRINGLTLRLILWRETLSTMNGLDYVFGKGVTKETNKHLNKHLIDLGLKNHIGFNPHNQYVDTFWRTGIIGLLLLILIPVYSLVIGIKRKDKLLMQFSLFMLAVMCSESIFGRVNGIYFFTTVILLLMNTNKLNENSNTRN
ncbi:O-antigen ligase [Cellulophaga sp. RHA19]|uniref:O-antigen ligase family protein n=1 Tax=Cellulophaga sp. RHA19 TaxID=1798237 RepID=UPI000C2C4120|nr:O-antigen ligase family protein [Cellulophaga sp. RHA19]PKB42608.1 O-antigen ligase [Cellulophaga sp. RHA19]